MPFKKGKAMESLLKHSPFYYLFSYFWQATNACKHRKQTR